MKTGVYISRRRPAGVKTVTDHVLFFSVFTDGFEAYSQFVKGPRSYFGVIGKLHNANSYDSHSPIFTRFVSVMAKRSGVNVMERVNVLLLLLGSLGRDGAYFKMNGEWHHYRWFIQSLCGDVIALQDINSESGKLSSEHNCIFGSCRRWRFEPLRRSYEDFSFPSSLRKSPISVEVSPPFWFSGKNDLYSNVSLIVNAEFEGGECALDYLRRKGLLDGCSEETNRRLAVDFQDARSLFGVLDRDQCVFWKGSSSMEMMEKEGEVRTGDKPKVVDLDMICTGEEKTRNMIDFMHCLPNFFLRHLQYMNGEVPTKSVMADYPRFVEYVSNSFSGRDAKSRLSIPEVVMLAAIRRANKFFVDVKNRRFEWIKGEILIPAKFKKLTCEQKCVFALGFFDYIFQDSLAHPYVFALKQCLDLMGCQYNWSRDFAVAVRLQAKLNFFLGVIEVITPPGFSNFSTHVPHHFIDEQKCGGTLKEYDNFFNESLLGLNKKQAKGGSKPEMGMAKRAFMIQNLELQNLRKQLREEETIQVKGPMKAMEQYEDMLKGLPWETITYCNFVDDNEFHFDDSLGHVSFLDMFPEMKKEDVARMNVWKQMHLPYQKDCRVSPENGIGNEGVKVFPTVKWYGETLVSASLPGDFTLKWLQKNEACIAFSRNSDSRIVVYMVLGFVQMKVNERAYIQAVCQPLCTRSLSSFGETQQKVAFSLERVVRSVSIVSLFRLHIGRGVVVEFESGVVEYVTGALMCRQSRPIGHYLLFEHVEGLRKRRRQVESGDEEKRKKNDASTENMTILRLTDEVNRKQSVIDKLWQHVEELERKNELLEKAIVKKDQDYMALMRRQHDL